MALTWPAAKDPDEVKDYRLIWTNMLTGGDTISSSVWTITAGTGLTIDSQATENAETVVWLSGGVEGTNLTLLNEIVTTGGRTYQQSVKLRCRSK